MFSNIIRQLTNRSKTAAMFGLDARIALAIFGALSVISGAALFNAIKAAKTEQWRQYFENIIKASEQYYLDNGKSLSISPSADLQLYMADLVTNRENLKTWEGPYISTDYASFLRIQDNMTKQIDSSAYAYIYLRNSSNWTEMNDLNTDEHCVINNTDCSEWIVIYTGNQGDPTKMHQLFNDLDSLVDNADGYLKGKVRYNTQGNDYLMYQSIPHKRR